MRHIILVMKSTLIVGLALEIKVILVMTLVGRNGSLTNSSFKLLVMIGTTPITELVIRSLLPKLQLLEEMKS